MSEFKEIQWSSAADKIAIHHNYDHQPVISWHDSAMHVVDDFTKVSPLEITENTLVSDAEQKLRNANRRYACIKNQNGEMTGLLALRELHGRKATQLSTVNQTGWRELAVKELMLPLLALPQVKLESLTKAKVGDAAATLKASGRDFLLVINNGEVCGVVSSLRIAELTGESVNVYHLPSTFAEIISAINHHQVID
ncbi:MAG TPA: hypothetical protein DCS01_11400 [Idiomarina abyssalis]|jgi:signal-transduction protein with cAMP-binding, CBS, and nucleotidyltransferase domain|uniref:hypothetical protein n=1 Tax=Idiomarina TaxID=135575 RepID=UPI000C506B86|nr:MULTISPECIES: hypothetical protein [Idiomarina]MAB21258.1 hypothetical protein [Idiomarina sp.]MBE91811.1 hypothetical protein [Idiomarina sp.]MBH93903.1 hypothetical protein [Idiomarina sp.]HAS15889.1 hypothetical protein [Idiomarina abyssalis]|tara:strand:+ start:504 stop:1091 length:588 start_codon:yes stop_codon:yes gene_type:complete